MTLDELQPGEGAFIKQVSGSGALRHHLLDMGLTPHTEVTLQKVAPMGDPIQLKVRGYDLTLRLDEARNIEVDGVHRQEDEAYVERRSRDIAHPGVGELDYAPKHHKHDPAPIPKGAPLSFALVGNQNCGKTTLFNQLTGTHQHVGNFPGVTVDRKDGQIRGHREARVTDLPGIYSLSPYSSEEIVTRDFLLESQPDGIINIVDATNLERNLYLTMQLMELGIPMVLALNMMDEVRANGGSILLNELEAVLGIPVVPIAAAKNEGVDELVDHAMHMARHHRRPMRIDFCKDSDVQGDPIASVHRAIHATAHMIEPETRKIKMPLRFAATKLIEKDRLMAEKLSLPQEKQEMFAHILTIMQQETGLDAEAAMAHMRFTFITNLCVQTVVRPHESREHQRSVMIDRILTGRYTAIPSFMAIMAFIFTMTFAGIGAMLTDGMAVVVGSVTAAIDTLLTATGVNPVVHDLLINGALSGIGSVISFLPTIVTLFFFLSILEDTGYMARVAFVMDRLLRRIGLSGRSIVPMLVGFGCSVPAVMATRTLASERDRKMTVLMIPFMSCSAKLPIYALLIGAFFPQQWQAIIMIGLYFTGIIVGILFALLLRRTRFRGEPVPFVMELPNYRLPSAKSVARLIWDKAKGFLIKAFTIIFLASIIIWCLQMFDARLNVAAAPEQSLLAAIGKLAAPVFAPLGFGDWRVATALITGFMAKETVVSTLTVLLGGDITLLQGLFTPLTALVLLVFILLYTPCVAAISTMRREIGGVNAFMTVIVQCMIAWSAAYMVRRLLLLFV
ncbi:ferrous iron transport protein B [Selenomonas sp. GACV-9]|uniref:ferrous iron transport protein B n=1 Tax=Selenomonas sp. GACV-9 TaxID=3158782 RepID=UPI0008E5ECB2|nr:ferrous iron transport protein B [Selenomonas ruminantium]